MSEIKANDVKKYLNGIIASKKKYVTSERLSKIVGVYPEIINDCLSYFEPTLKMDPDFNLLELVPIMKQYLIKIEENKNNALIHKPIKKKKVVVEYTSIGDFIYQKMTIGGGLLNKNARLSEADLKTLRKMINIELKTYKEKKNK